MKHEEDVLQELESAVDAFASRSLGPQRARAARALPGGFDRALWKRMAELGWLGILVPEAYGGLGLGLREMTIVARRLSAAILPEPLSACAVLAAQCLVDAQDEDLKRSLLPALCAGELMPTVAWQERIGQIDSEAAAVGAERTRAGWTLTGTKCCVPYGDVADGFIVTARSAAGTGLYWVAGRSGVTVASERLADDSTQATVRFDAAAARCLRQPGPDAAFLDHALDAARLIAAGELIGVAAACLELTLNYLRTRTQFGKPIGSFQALQHRAVDLYMHKEFSVCALDAALAQWEGATSPTQRSAAASRAKARCSQTALQVSRESIQMHGAIGWTDECDVGLYVKRSLLLSAWLGNATANRRRYARLHPLQPKH